MNIEESEALMIDSLCLIIPAIGKAIHEDIPLTKMHHELIEGMIEMLDEISLRSGMCRKYELAKKWPALKGISRGAKTKASLEAGLEELCNFTYEAETTFIILKMQISSQSIMDTMKEIMEKAGK